MENPEVDAAMATLDATPDSAVEGSQEEEDQESSEGLETTLSSASKPEIEQTEQEQEQEKEKEQDQDQEKGKEEKKEKEKEKDEDQESIISSRLCEAELEGGKPRTPKRVLAFVRVKPSARFAQDVIKLGSDNKSIDIYVQKSPRGGVVNNSQTDWSFKLDGLLHNASQEMVYDTVARGLVSKALQGYNGTIMCYGQTGAGKTYTMTGAASEYRNRGIIPRAIQQVFKSAAEFLNILVTVRISYLEIYNEAMFDLLAPALGRACKENLAVMDGPQGVYVKGLSIHPVSHEEEALHLLFEGETNRVIAEHSLNKNSSRSHCIFTMYLECRSRDYTNHKCLKSKITLIDLAGSERLSKTGSGGQVRVEASYINKSLSFLEQLVIALADPKREHIPFRQSKLTHVLKDSLGGNCNTVLVTNIYGEAEHVEETLSSLRFATRMNWVTAEPAPNEPLYREVSVKALEEEIQLLKRELLLQDSLTNRSGATYSPLTTTQRAEIRSQVQKYLRGVIEEIDIVNVRQIQEVFRQFKVIVSQQEEEVESRLWSKYGLGHRDITSESESKSESGSSSELHLAEDMGSKVDKDKDLDQGTLETGRYPTSLLPDGKKEAKNGDVKERLRSPPPGRIWHDSSPTKGPIKDLDEEEEGGDQNSDEEASIPSSEDSQKLRKVFPGRESPPSKQKAFELFKREAGREIYRIFRENKKILVSRKKRSHSVAQRINRIKQQMEGIKEALEAQKQKRSQEGEYTDEKGQVIIDEKEFSLIRRLKELKEEHRAGFTELQDLKAEIQYCQQLVDKCRKKLISEFEIWYNESFLIPEDVREALKPGGNITPGMIPINRIMCLDEDEQDKFERMQETALPDCPGSVSFYRARMKMDQKQSFNRSMAALRKTCRKPGVVSANGKKKALSFLPIT